MPRVTVRLLLDEMLSDDLAAALRTRGHDVRAVVADHAMVALPDATILATATAEGRAVVTRNIKDFVDLDAATGSAGTPPHCVSLSSHNWRVPGRVLDVWARGPRQ